MTLRWLFSRAPCLAGRLRLRSQAYVPHRAGELYRVQLLLIGLAFGLFGATAEAASDSDCIQDGGKAICLKPDVGGWQYLAVRCGPASYGPFDDEDSALRAGVEGEYIHGSGCSWTAPDAGAWGTDATPTRGACGGLSAFPIQWCKSDTQALVECGIETDNYRNALIRYTYTPALSDAPCSAVAQDGIDVRRHREVQCRAGSKFVRLRDGSFLCQAPVEESNDGKSCCTVGNPINPATGNKYQEETDYVGAGPFPLGFRRSYNSNTAQYRDVGLGAGWTSNYHSRLNFSDAGGLAIVSALRADGKVLTFVRTGADWVPNTSVSDRLLQSSDGSRWLYTNASGDEIETYDVAGKLLSIANRAGLAQRLSYDGRNRLVAVSDPFGRQLAFGYDGADHIVSMQDPDSASGRYTFAYDGGNLMSVAYPDATTRTYQYEDARFPHALTGITDENGTRYASWAYNGIGRASLSEHAGGADHVEVDHGLNDGLGAMATVTDARGVHRTYYFDQTALVARVSQVTPACDKCGLPKTAEYDANGNRARVTDYNFQQTEFRYDLSRNLMTQRIDASNQAAERRYTSIEWHPQFRLPLRLSEPLRRTTYRYDEHGNVISKMLQATADGDGTAGFDALPTATRAWTYTYTYSSVVPGHVQRLVVDGPRTDAADLTAYDWDDNGNLIAVTNALGHVTSLGDYDAHGRARRITDPNGLVITLAYDPRGRLASRNDGGEITAYTYDGAGQLVKLTTPDGSTLSYIYDDAHRLTELRDSLGNRIIYMLDATGNRVQEQVFDSNQVLVQRRFREYDALDRLVKDIGGTNPATQVTQYAYDNQGNLVSVVDSLGHVTTNVYDALNRIKQVIDPAASESGSGGITRYVYDGLDQVTQVTDSRSLSTSYTIDGLGNLTRLASPDTGITSSAYDTAGNLVSQLDARGVTTSMRYDALNRLTQASYTPAPGSDVASVSIAYTYDVSVAEPNAPERGRLTGMTDPSGTTSYLHDLQGRIVQEARVIGGRRYITGYRYDAAGRLAGITYPSGRTVTYGFDALGRIAQVDTSYLGMTQPVVTGVAYQPFGSVKTFAYGNASAAVRTFDADGRMVSYTLGGITRNVSYDEGSRIVAFRHADTALDQSFLYDNLDRLSNWSTRSNNESFLYDAVGNRISHTIGANTYPYIYSAVSNQITHVSGPSNGDYRYDAAGAISATSQLTFAYDARHRLIQASVGGRNTAYTVNGLGQRVMKTPGTGAATVYHYDIQGRVLAESDSQGNVQVEYVYLGEIPVAVMR
jgi:YD repeat-containing protein